MLPLTPVLMLDIFGSSDYFQPVLKILIISVLMLDIFGSSNYFQPVLEFTFLTVPLFLNATFEQTSRETVGTSKRVTQTKIHILLQSVYIRKNRHKKSL